MKLKQALHRIYMAEQNGELRFAVLRNINTGNSNYIATGEDGAYVIERIGDISSEEREELGMCDDWEMAGTCIENFKYLVEEVTDHQWGVAFVDECPVKSMGKGSVILRPGTADLRFYV